MGGNDDRLVVRADGGYALSRAGRRDVDGRLSGTELDTLRQQLAASNFARLPHDNKGDSITDGYHYRLVYQGREVLADDGGVPASLEDVIGTLNLVIAEAGK